MHPNSNPSSVRTSNTAPFGLDLSLAVFDRTTRLARSLFGNGDASIILCHNGEIWRSRYASQLPTEDPITEGVLRTGEVLWIEDGLTDPRVKDHPLVTGPIKLRFCVAVPITLEDGTRPGVLSISGWEPEPFNPGKLARLRDLAAFVADEWLRARTMRDYAESVRERDLALQRSASSEERLNMALMLADLHVWELDFERGILIKAGAEDTFFARPQTFEDIRDDLYVVVDARDLAQVKDEWRKHRDTGVPFHPEFRVARPDGKVVWARSTIRSFVEKDGKLVRILGALQNITERKTAEQALIQAKSEADAANQAKSAFLATMSHEIRTPLNGVLGMAQAMAADELSPVQRQRLDVVRQSGEALLVILNDVLDISKIEAGRIELERITFDLEEMAANAWSTFASLARDKGLAFMLDAEAASGLYRGDPTRLRQILVNLISNAVKFTERGEIQVRIAHQSGWLEIMVRDTGVGIAKEQLNQLFRKFAQADSSTTRRYGGTGLGLAICRELTELMGGEISADSQPGVGTVFRIHIPLARIGDAPKRSPKSPAPPEPAQPVAPTRLARILAVEDNVVNQKVLQTLLLQAGLEPVIVANGAEAVEAWRAEPWDAIIMDVQMPVMDGPTATRKIRELEGLSACLRTPIIGLTANAMPHQVAEYETCGMDVVVTKPIEVKRLFDALDRALNGEFDPAAHLA
jgi:signal transduction histidine kinase/ActR/RegA family two-component response regulator